MEEKVIYEAEFERTQEYLSYCLHLAKEYGLSDLISKFRQHSPCLPTNSSPMTSPKQLPPTIGNPNLAAIAYQAKAHGWYIDPNEVSGQFHLLFYKHFKYKHTYRQVQCHVDPCICIS